MWGAGDLLRAGSTVAAAPAIAMPRSPTCLRHDVSVLSPEDLERFRARLEEELASVQARIQARTEELEGTGDPEPGDLGDEAQSIDEREQAIDDNSDDRELLGRIDGALSRIKTGTYGISEVSGKPIPIERLEALPTATTLVDEESPRT
jgi:DnaK suppressor protein